MIPMFPLESSPLPGEVLPLRIFEPRYSQLVSDCLTMPDPSFWSGADHPGPGSRRR